MMNLSSNPYFTRFQSMVSSIPIPDEFTYPFYYEPHELSRIASKELQERLRSEDFQHNFGVEENEAENAIGKMFGVLVVRNIQGELGYLSAFSGKLGNSNNHKGFVPPVFDTLKQGDFLDLGMERLSVLNQKVKEQENSAKLRELRERLLHLEETSQNTIEAFREEIRERRRLRKVKRASLPAIMNATERAIIENDLIRESLSYKFRLREMIEKWKHKIGLTQAELTTELEILKALKTQRKELSYSLQQQIFEKYTFLNAHGETKDVNSIFRDTKATDPPAGAGECAAPKLLQYAFENKMKPIAMAEFWWGASPKSEIRKHQHFYPSCRGKCEPILGHMLQGVKVAPNPILKKPDFVAPLDIVFEDDSLVIVNKPSGLLSVPGKADLPNIYSMVLERYPNATGPMIIHRLDMATSGLLLFTKTKEANKFVQTQFINKTISKRYVALLDGSLTADEGIVNLPLRHDLEDRPRQLVCYKHGKEAITRWRVVNRLYGKTRVHFYPVTGRTHQLRMHAAHPDGLNTPIIGDHLYGIRDKRLHLHAEKLTFVHPVTRKEQTVFAAAPF